MSPKSKLEAEAATGPAEIGQREKAGYLGVRRRGLGWFYICMHGVCMLTHTRHACVCRCTCTCAEVDTEPEADVGCLPVTLHLGY